MLNKLARVGAIVGAAAVAFTAALPALAAPPPDVFKDSREMFMCMVHSPQR